MKHLLALLLLMSLSLPHLAGAPAWHSDGLIYRGDHGRTDKPPRTGLTETLEVLWEFQTGAPVPTFSGLVVHNSVAYYAAGNALLALDIADGTERWRTPLAGLDRPLLFSKPVISHDLVLNSSASGLLAFDADTGTESWRFGWTPPASPLDDPANPVVVDGLVLVGVLEHGAGMVYALDAVSGRERWHFSTGITASPQSFRRANAPSVAVSNDVVYVTNPRGSVFALNRASGEELWRRELGDEIVRTPVSIEQSVVLQTEEGAVWVLDAASGNGNHFQLSEETPIRRSLVAAPLYLSSGPSSLQALELSTGEETWRYQGANVEILAITGDVVVAEVDGKLVGLNLIAGNELWQADFGVDASEFFATEETVYAARGDTVASLDPETGAALWQFGEAAVLVVPVTPTPAASTPEPSVADIPPVGIPPSISLIVDGDRVIFLDGVGYVHGLDTSTGAELWRFGPGQSTSA